MPTVAVLDMAGKEIEKIDLSESVFGIEPNVSVMHDVVKNYLANQRQGTQSALTRAEVSGGGKKPWRPVSYTHLLHKACAAGKLCSRTAMVMSGACAVSKASKAITRETPPAPRMAMRPDRETPALSNAFVKPAPSVVNPINRPFSFLTVFTE